MVRVIVMAAFSVKKTNSIAYRKFVTIEGFKKAIGNIIEKHNPDYISVRIIEMERIG